MALPRRALLLAAPYLLVRPAQAATLRLEPAADGLAALTGPGIRRPLRLPARAARMLPTLACGGETLAVAAFRDAADGAALDWLVLALPQDGSIALLALEPLTWRTDATRMNTRISAAGDRMRLLCQRDSASRETSTLWRRETWTDHLAWTPPCTLADAPVRPPLPGTRQHALALWRHRAAALVDTAPTALSPAVLAAAGLQAATFSLAVSITPSMYHPSARRSIV